MKNLTFAVPVHNEERALEPLHHALSLAAAGLPDFRCEFLFIDDGSSDGSWAVLKALKSQDPRVKAVSLSRNFGQQAALACAVDQAEGDALILLDADFEDRPEDAAKLIEHWTAGAQVVYAERGRREAGFLRGLLFKLHHSLSAQLESPLPAAGAFSLIDKSVLSVLRALPESQRYLPGLRAWAGFKQVAVSLDRGKRYDNKPRNGLLRLSAMALGSYISFSKLPLKLASLLGLLMSLTGFAAILFIVIYQLFLGFAVSGWASLMVTVILASGVQLLCLGILGEYVGHILDETKRRPTYVVRERA